ncbi:neprilysin-2-like [Homalodisca vitripennis]|uniref:neprilysin-2-like n=1 Tax=Homalodisca vitripennis TaxID=197043 RepID=UPI001EEBE97C|nr:neprilysin-2-like [Homalodisca vitripennis]
MFVRFPVIVLLLLHSKMGKSNRSVCVTDGCIRTAQRILDHMDPSVRPCDDFYRFACGKFLRTAVIQDDKVENGVFVQVDDALSKLLKNMLLENSSPTEPHPYKSMKQLFSICLDEKKINDRGVSHAVSRLQAAGGWPVLGNWSEIGWNFQDTEIKLRNLLIGGGSLFSISVIVDLKNTSRHVIGVDQGELGLAREILIKGLSDPLVQTYYSYMVDIAVMYGAERRFAEVKLNESLLFEIELAKITTPKEGRRNPNRMYNPYELQNLMEDIRWINWKALLKGIMPASVSPRENEIIIVKEVDYLKKLEKLLQKHSNEAIANYMMWKAANGMVSMLTNQMRERQIKYLNVVYGLATREPRWKECIGTASSLTLALSSIYVKKYFDEASKNVALDMISIIRDEVIQDIDELDWMDEQTKKKAKYKVSRMVPHVGYPDELTNTKKIEDFYEGLTINNDNYFEALMDLARWQHEYKYRLLREDVNKTDWRTHGSVTDINAFYNHVENSIQFPAGILQHPFFSAQVPEYVNYARIGFIIGHEITHGFDDKGSRFDFRGNLKEWWDKESKEKFSKKKKCIIDQYSNFKDNQTQLNLNGVNTQGENIADIGGFKIAYRAYKRRADRLPKPEPVLPNLEQYSNDQLFMLNMANVWCSIVGTDAMKMRIITAVHSPAEFRVNGVLKNFPEFSKAFQCGPTDPMNPKKKCSIW